MADGDLLDFYVVLVARGLGVEVPIDVTDDARNCRLLTFMLRLRVDYELLLIV